ncbi:hypothetical protein [Amycolatopsis sp.]|uniref:hypothetical protein n=1 Tax=Amycolatopsis sp. TaxID=37632 RepID=UPI002B52E851|nr:hypothetical protein [Amycolatopsis sp.]HVV09522.1 hypothetical protein [Amycolatopsis sp.]
METGEITALLPEWPLRFVTEGLPENWAEIARSGDAEERRLRALALWNRDLLDLVPGFAETAARTLVDVRTCIAWEKPLLVYVFDNGADGKLAFAGWAPADTTEPRLWSSVPAPLRKFLREVHAGFVAADGESFGPLPPRSMRTLAELADSPDGDPDWDEDAAEDGRPLSTRLMQIARNAGLIMHCVSPDLPPGQIALVYEGDVDPTDFGPAFDELLVTGIRNQ